MEIKDSVAIITGGGSGIGQAIAIHLAKNGAKVVVAGRSEENLLDTIQKISAIGKKAEYCLCNVEEESEVKHLMSFTMEKFGSINVVIPAAAVMMDSSLVSVDKETRKIKNVASLENFKKTFDTNVTGAFLVVREAVSVMVDNNFKGVICLFSSLSKAGTLGQLSYASTKAIMALWPKILIGEFHAKKITNIRVNAIAPGYVDTPIYKNTPPSIVDKLILESHLGRLILPEEIAQFVEHIILNEAINGACLDITGGAITGGIVK